jgi:iron(III) transport system substrate-binding protein
MEGCRDVANREPSRNPEILATVNYIKPAPRFCLFVALALLLAALAACGKKEIPREVVVYTSVDQVFSEPVLREFERTSGIRVKPVYDVEAAKTTGLATRLVAEKDRPRADVFWNNEFLQTLRLKDQGVLAASDIQPGAGLPAKYFDPQGYWFGLGARARVFLINTALVKPADFPHSLTDLLDPKYPPEKVGMALPLFGTSSTQAAALYSTQGPQNAREFYGKIKSRGVRICDGNSSVRDLVVSGQLLFGLTDTDDAMEAVGKGAPVEVVAPDQDAQGTMIVFGTVALVKGAPNPSEARELIAYLLNAETEMIRSGCFQWSLRDGRAVTPMFPNGLRAMDASPDDVLRSLPTATQELREIFVR